MLNFVKKGDTVTRMLADQIPMELKVTGVSKTVIWCGGWRFDKATGAELDDLLQWGPRYGISGSFIRAWRKATPPDMSGGEGGGAMRKP